MDSVNEKPNEMSLRDLLLIIIKQNQVIIQQGEYLASKTYSIKHFGVSSGFGTGLVDPEDQNNRKIIHEKAIKTITDVNDALYRQESYKDIDVLNKIEDNIQQQPKAK